MCKVCAVRIHVAHSTVQNCCVITKAHIIFYQEGGGYCKFQVVIIEKK